MGEGGGVSLVPWQQELGMLPRARDGSVWEESGTSSGIGMSRVVLILYTSAFGAEDTGFGTRNAALATCLCGANHSAANPREGRKKEGKKGRKRGENKSPRASAKNDISSPVLVATSGPQLEGPIRLPLPCLKNLAQQSSNVCARCVLIRDRCCSREAAARKVPTLPSECILPPASTGRAETPDSIAALTDQNPKKTTSERSSIEQVERGGDSGDKDTQQMAPTDPSAAGVTPNLP